MKLGIEANPFHANLELSSEAHVLHLSGELDLGSTETLRRIIDPLAADPGVRLILDVRDMTYIDSTGIGILVSALKARQACGGLMSVRNVPVKIRRLFDITGLSKFLNIEGDAS